MYIIIAVLENNWPKGKVKQLKANMQLLANDDGTYNLIVDLPKAEAEFAKDFFGKKRLWKQIERSQKADLRAGEKSPN